METVLLDTVGVMGDDVKNAFLREYKSRAAIAGISK